MPRICQDSWDAAAAPGFREDGSASTGAFSRADRDHDLRAQVQPAAFNPLRQKLRLTTAGVAWLALAGRGGAGGPRKPPSVGSQTFPPNPARGAQDTPPNVARHPAPHIPQYR